MPHAAALAQPLTGAWLAHTAGWLLTTPWLLLSVALSVLAGGCLLPVLWLQCRMAREIEAARAKRRQPGAMYRRWQVAWERLGAPGLPGLRDHAGDVLPDGEQASAVGLSPLGQREHCGKKADPLRNRLGRREVPQAINPCAGRRCRRSQHRS
ncbi:DUF2269 family protein [Roseateles sp.]|uniref:DUF2269 family protein n=1 Tax=Roseateles sp. TaxID=1971397 RepID=UPI0039EA9157